VASTAAGSQVLGVSHFGYASGTAGGIAPKAHIAIYKAFWSTRGLGLGSASDTLAAMDQAIADGVDILNLSLQFGQRDYFEDAVAIGALSAIERGIVVIGAAGNDGPESGTVVNGAPWITTVGAGTVDRSFTAELKLGNGLTIEGTSYFPQSVYITNASLHYDVSNFAKRICNSSALDPEEVSGKVVLCDSSNGTDLLAQIQEVRRVRAIAGIFISDQIIPPFGYVIPSVALPTKYGPKVTEYAMRQNPRPTVKSMKFVMTRLGQTQAPKVASLSSRGPDPFGHGILKPDILAPGYEILAAIAPVRVLMNVGNYNLVTDYRLNSGTSMATPHIAGVAALVKAVHPDWSPAAIRSALMTTANTVDNKESQIQDQSTGLLATPLDFGAGHVDPNKAMDPGLVYDMGFEDYVEFICGLGYNKTQISVLLRRNEWICSENQTDLNYPSFNAEFFKRGKSIQGKKFKRTLTNVGDDVSTYTAVLVVPDGMRIRVEPRTMTFTRKYQKQSFTLSVEIDENSPSINYGFLKWIDQHNHVVASPVVALNS
jgi:subtilisin family serine protease